MKNLPLQTTVKPAQAESSVLQTALDWKGILILSRFKVQQKQGQWYLEKSNQRAAAEANWEELLGLLLKLNHCQAPAIHFSAMLLNCFAREKMCFSAQRGTEVTNLGEFNFQKDLTIIQEKNMKNRINVRIYRRDMNLTITITLVKSCKYINLPQHPTPSHLLLQVDQGRPVPCPRMLAPQILLRLSFHPQTEGLSDLFIPQFPLLQQSISATTLLIYFVSAWKYITQYMLGGIPCHFWVLSPPSHL